MKMNRKRNLIWASAAFISAALVGLFISSTATQESVKPTQNKLTSPPTLTNTYLKAEGVWTYNCEFPVQRPDQIMLTCADGGMIVTDIKWQTWGANGAVGTGIYSQNMCEPSCAEGKRVDVPARLKLSQLFEYKGRKVLRALDITAVSGRELPDGTAGFTWNVSEFAVQMNWDVR